MKMESSVTGRQIRFYEDSGKYLGAIEIAIRGPRAIMTSLDSKNFYKNFDLVWEFINLTCNTSIWHAHVTPEHYDAIMRIIDHSKYYVKLLAIEGNAHRDQCWIEVTQRR